MSVVLTGTVVAKSLLGAAVVFAASETPAAATGDPGSLYVAVSGVLVAGISAFAVIYTSRNRPVQPASPAEPVTDWELVQEMAELYAQAVNLQVRAQLQSEMWEARARGGWKES